MTTSALWFPTKKTKRDVLVAQSKLCYVTWREIQLVLSCDDENNMAWMNQRMKVREKLSAESLTRKHFSEKKKVESLSPTHTPLLLLCSEKLPPEEIVFQLCSSKVRNFYYRTAWFWTIHCQARYRNSQKERNFATKKIWDGCWMW